MQDEGKRVYENHSPHAFLNHGGRASLNSTLQVAFSDRLHRNGTEEMLNLPSILRDSSVEVKREGTEQKQLQMKGALNMKHSQSGETIETTDLPSVGRFETEG